MGSPTEISHRCFARVGLLGNPSDGYFGKTISFSLANFSACVTLRPADVISVTAHPVHDQAQYSSLQELAATPSPTAFSGGVRLLLSLCRSFALHCSRKGIQLPENQNFTLSYDTNIPRQAGLSGSSAIVTAGLLCLIEYFKMEHKISLEDRPSVVLQAETDLGITAGLQDRVIQVYGGCVFMDFDEDYMSEHGHGRYKPLNVNLLPKFHVIYADNPSDSGRVHSTVRQRWLEGDETVRWCMGEIARLADEGKEALLLKNYEQLGKLMDRNFDLRRQMFGDSALGAVNIDMVETAREVGAAAKFCGSGGAVVALCLEGEDQVNALKEMCKQKGYSIVEAHIGSSRHAKSDH